MLEIIRAIRRWGAVKTVASVSALVLLVTATDACGGGGGSPGGGRAAAGGPGSSREQDHLLGEQTSLVGDLEARDRGDSAAAP